MDTAQLIALVVLVALAVAVALFIRRGARLLYRTRVAEGFRGEALDLSGHVAHSLAEVAVLIDRVRRRDTDGEAIRGSLSAAREAVERYIGEARSLTTPATAQATQVRMVEELERAGRALELVEHGCDLARDGDRMARGPEADTSIKRGYLNLVHARESFHELVNVAIEQAEEASPVRNIGRRNR
ncbi:MAG: hypothetical protein ABI555_09860 [Chloroflexota bacterium]